MVNDVGKGLMDAMELSVGLETTPGAYFTKGVESNDISCRILSLRAPLVGVHCVALASGSGCFAGFFLRQGQCIPATDVRLQWFEPENSARLEADAHEIRTGCAIIFQ